MCQHTDPGMTLKHKDLIHSGRVATIAVSSPDVAEEADDHYWRQALKQQARVCRHVSSAGYDIEVIDSDALRRVVS